MHIESVLYGALPLIVLFGNDSFSIISKQRRQHVHLQYLNCVENGLDLRTFLEEKGYEYITTADKEGSQSGVADCLCIRL